MSETIPTEIKTLTATNWFYDEIKRLRAKLPKNYKAALFERLPPEYNTKSGIELVSSVMSCRSTDMTIYYTLKSLANE